MAAFYENINEIYDLNLLKLSTFVRFLVIYEEI